MSLPYILIRSSRRTLSIQIRRDGGLIARAPLKMSLGLIEDFIQKKIDWIKKHQKRIQDSRFKIEKKEYSEKLVSEMKQKLAGYIESRVRELWTWQNLPPYTSIRVTRSEHRWGSCSGKNGLCFSYRLSEWLTEDRVTRIDTEGITYNIPEGNKIDSNVSTVTVSVCSPFIDAIIVHELAHLREKNHQKPFWDLVYRMMPEYEKIMKDSRNT